MSPKVYFSLWIVTFGAAAALWLGNSFTLTTLIVFGFIAFGLVFTGMMCVLPNVVAHPSVLKEVPETIMEPKKGPAGASGIVPAAFSAGVKAH